MMFPVPSSFPKKEAQTVVVDAVVHVVVVVVLVVVTSGYVLNANMSIF